MISIFRIVSMYQYDDAKIQIKIPDAQVLPGFLFLVPIKPSLWLSAGAVELLSAVPPAILAGISAFCFFKWRPVFFVRRFWLALEILLFQFGDFQNRGEAALALRHCRRIIGFVSGSLCGSFPVEWFSRRIGTLPVVRPFGPTTLIGREAPLASFRRCRSVF